MNEKALRILEFNKVKEEIKKYALTGASKDTIDELAPYENIHEVKEHLQETKEALTLLQKKGAPPFEGLYDVREAITRAGKGGTLNPGQLLKIGNMVRCARRFIDFIKRKDEEQSYNILEDICAGLTPIRKLEDTIFNAIIGEEEISDKASQTLNNIRRSLKEKNSSVRDKVNSILRENSKFLQDNLYTMRGDRYVIPVKAEHKGSVPGLIHDQSSTGATLFIEPMSLVKINNEIKELMLKEKAEIERILQELSGFVYDEIIAVRNNANILNELDFIFAKAKYASAIDGICPAVNGNGIVDLVQAKHPLIDPKRVVASDIYLGREFTSLVVTGPNTGGKTVTLKTVGLLHIMAMSGVLIPARENSTVSFFREIYADIGDEQSIEQSLSTFSSHMTNIVSIMEEADNESLILFDELGAGTDPTEGAALAVAILETLRHRNCKIVATTHYSELKGYALRTIGVENASVEFDVETLRPTYKLLIGIPGKSNAFEISRRLGLSGDVIDKSKELISSESLQFEDLIQSLQEKSMKAERDAREAEMLKLDARKLREKYEVKLENLEKTRENAFGEARREAKQILREAKEEADQILKNMRELERLGYDSDARRKLEEQRSKLRDKLDKTETVINKAEKDNGETIEVVKPGMEAFLPSLNQKVIILTMPDSKGDVQVEAGIMKVNVKLKDLRKSKETKETKKKVKREVNLNTKSVASSVDLRGLDAEEACYNADKYLDEAYMAGLGEVSLIHGKGTGILRKSINDMLRSHPHVKSYRLGEYGEGGTGVTVVQLK
ncbi:endonuclease MutS2 [Clostridium folliculivorans]|uniref:Endonuclease MutS2 n=1 Tax=Clostridium folliculivorans TaxID=2886038 RepID=A0A9W5XZG2_9CLOT|nr:endonuclease MutS2 [Clostridium folliculivorans]GKU23934.1 endonuclease MutS2 [Clostridium folliculivorans]GKU30049.1 endonuclease MutS2 [Clostridium folliculivorans]